MSLEDRVKQRASMSLEDRVKTRASLEDRVKSRTPDIEQVIQQRYENYVSTYERNKQVQDKYLNKPNMPSAGIFGVMPQPNQIPQEKLPDIFEDEKQMWKWINNAKSEEERNARLKFTTSENARLEGLQDPLIDPVDIIAGGITGGLIKSGLKAGAKQTAKAIGSEILSNATFGTTDLAGNLTKSLIKKATKEAVTPAGKIALDKSKQFLEDTMASVYKRPIDASKRVTEPLPLEEFKKAGNLFDVPYAKLPYINSTDLYSLGKKVPVADVDKTAPYVNRLAERLGKDDTTKIIQKNLARIEKKGESELVKELTKAIYQKDKIGKYGSVVDVVNKPKVQPFIKIVNDVPVSNITPTMEVVEAEKNVLKSLPIMMKGKDFRNVAKEYRGTQAIKKSGAYTTPIRKFDELGKDFKSMTYDVAREAEGAAKTEYINVAKELDSLKLNKKESERIMIYATAQEGGQATLTEMKKVVPQLTEKEMNAYNWMRSKYDEIADRVDDIRAQAGMPPLGSKVNVNGQTVYQRPKNYFTWIRNLDYAKQAGFDLATAQYDVIEDFINKNTTAFAFAKQRKKNVLPIELDAVNVFKKYMNSALDNVHLSPVITKVNKMRGTLTDVLPDGTQQTWKLSEKNPYLDEFLREWAGDLAGKKRGFKVGGVEFDKLDRFASWANKNLIYSSLSGNVRSTLIQPLSFRNTVSGLGLKDTMSGIGMNLNKGWRNFARNNSNALKTRLFEHGFEETIKGNKISKALRKGQEKIGDLELSGLKRLDMETATASWLGAFNKVKNQGIPMKEAIDFADDFVTKTQGSASKLDRIPIARTPTGRMFSLFQTFATYDYNFLKKDVLGIGTNMTKGQKVKTALRYLAATEMANIAMDAAGIDSPFPDPIKAVKESAENGDSGGMAAWKTLQEFLSVHPVFGSAKYGKTFGGAAINNIEDAIERTKKGKELPYGEWILTAGKLSGVPGLSPLSKFVKIKEMGGSNWQALMGEYPKKKKGLGMEKL